MKTYIFDALFSHRLTYEHLNMLIFFRNWYLDELDSNVDILMSIKCIY